MKVGIIGSGNIGGTLTRRLRALGHEVLVANSRGKDSLGDLAPETGAHPATVEETTQGTDLVIVSIPLKAVPGLPSGIFAGKTVVDTDNYYPARDGQIAELEAGTPSSRWTAQHLAGATIVKTFNNIMAQHLLEQGKPAGDTARIALPVAGDDSAAKAVVMALVDELGFDPIDAGTINESWRQQPNTPVYATDFDAQGVRQALAEADQTSAHQGG